MSRLVIVGARSDGSAKVVLDTLRLAGGWEIVGFLDDNRALWRTRLAGLEVLGGSDRLDHLHSEGVTHVAFAFGDNVMREALLRRVVAAGLTPANAIHPSAIVASDVSVGVGIWIAASVVINPGVALGDGVVVNTAATVDHDTVVEDYANISPGCHLSGRTRVGHHAFLGTGVITIPDVVIGEGAVVGAGAVVIRNVAQKATVAGVPARELRGSA